MKLTFMGAGSTVFAKNVLGDVMLTDNMHDFEIALYDIDAQRLEESFILIDAINRKLNEGRATVEKYLGVAQRKDALRNADFIVNAIQVGLYDPCTIIDFEIPKKYGLRQTIGDTLGIGGIMRGLRTIQVLKGFARDMEEVCPNALFLNYTNPMAIVTGFMQRYSKIRTVGLCHSVQACTYCLLTELGMEDKLDGRIETIAGINHMGWLLDIRDKFGNDLAGGLIGYRILIKERGALRQVSEYLIDKDIHIISVLGRYGNDLGKITYLSVFINDTKKFFPLFQIRFVYYKCGKFRICCY